MACKLDFFVEPVSELDEIKSKVKEVRESNDKVRKSMFAKHGTLERRYAELHERLTILERNICTGAIATTLRS
jgi:hypothetical protein